MPRVLTHCRVALLVCFQYKRKGERCKLMNYSLHTDILQVGTEGVWGFVQNSSGALLTTLRQPRQPNANRIGLVRPDALFVGRASGKAGGVLTAPRRLDLGRPHVTELTAGADCHRFDNPTDLR